MRGTGGGGLHWLRSTCATVSYENVVGLKMWCGSKCAPRGVICDTVASVQYGGGTFWTLKGSWVGGGAGVSPSSIIIGYLDTWVMACGPMCCQLCDSYHICTCTAAVGTTTTTAGMCPMLLQKHMLNLRRYHPVPGVAFLPHRV